VATITASRGGGELCITFGPVSGKLDWQVMGIQVTRDGRAVHFAQGQLGGVLAALFARRQRG
jgi:hypothetical protein